MGRERDSKSGDIYDNLLQRVATALQEAEAEGAEEVEVSGLTPWEEQLIQAYMAQDERWLAGWHAAASEQYRLRKAQCRLAARQVPALCRDQRRRNGLAHILDCALCGSEVAWPHASTEAASCSHCGSQIMKVKTRAGGPVRH